MMNLTATLSHNRRRFLPIVLAVTMLVSAAGMCADSAELEYAEAVSAESEKLTAAFNDISALMDEAAQDTTKFEDDEWLVRLESAAAKIKESDAALRALTPPERFKDVHAALIDGTGDCSEGMEKMTAGMDSADFALLQESIDLITSCSDKLTKANEELNELQ
jgi:hypothetical protein